MSAKGTGARARSTSPPSGRLSRIEALQNQGLTQNLTERERAAARTQVVDALRRLDEGSYGVCTACQAPIQLERLAGLPRDPHLHPCGSG